MSDDDQVRKKEPLHKIPGEIRLYIEKRVELLVLDIGQEFSKIAARSFYKSLGILIIFISFIFALFSLSLFLGDVLHNDSLGFLITSAPVFIIGLLLFILRPRKFVHKMSDQIFSMILQSYNNMSDSDNGEREEKESKK